MNCCIVRACHLPAWQTRLLNQDQVMEESKYERLLKAARMIRSWKSPTDLRRGLNQHGFEVTQQTISNWKARGISSLGALRVSEIIGCRATWLETGQGPMVDNRVYEPSDSFDNLLKKFAMVPLITLEETLIFCCRAQDQAPFKAYDWVPSVGVYGPRTYALRIEGESMTSITPGVHGYDPGTIIYVDPDKMFRSGQKVIAKVSDEEVVFRVLSFDAKRMYLRPINPQFPTIELKEGMKICGVLVGSYTED